MPPAFDPAKASEAWERTHPFPVDLDPPPRRLILEPDPSRIRRRSTADYRSRYRGFLRANPRATPGQRRKAIRDLQIAFGHEVLGISHRDHARLYGLPHSRISAILKQLRAPALDEEE